jgi:hypothetical protein
VPESKLPHPSGSQPTSSADISKGGWLGKGNQCYLLDSYSANFKPIFRGALGPGEWRPIVMYGLYPGFAYDNVPLKDRKDEDALHVFTMDIGDPPQLFFRQEIRKKICFIVIK